MKLLRIFTILPSYHNYNPLTKQSAPSPLFKHKCKVRLQDLWLTKKNLMSAEIKKKKVWSRYSEFSI